MGYFDELMSGNEEIDDSIRPLLKLSRETINRSQKLDYALVSSLERDPLLKERLERLRTVPGVGPITALTYLLATKVQSTPGLINGQTAAWKASH